MVVESIYKNAIAGRGLWVGLFLPSYPKVRHVIADWLPDDAHLTLLHLGKDRTVEDVEHLLAVVAQVRRLDSRPLEMELTGVGWFWRRREPTLVALVNSTRIFAMRGVTIGLLGDRGVVPNDAYGFIPHVTLRKEASVQDMASRLSMGPAVRVEIPQITVVCGDATVHL